MKTALVLGAGFGGATAAYLLAERGFKVTVLEGAPHPGGGCWTQLYAGHPYTFGPRVFFSRDDEVNGHLTSLVEMRQFFTRTWTFVEKDAQLYHYPLQRADLALMPDYERIAKELAEREKTKPSVDDFEDYWLSAIGPTLYEKFVNNYSKKMWGVESNRQLSASFEWVNRGTPIRDGDDRLYTDQFQGYPRAADGYNGYFRKALAKSTTVFNCFVKRFDPATRTVYASTGEYSGDVVINSIHIDTLFSNEYGRLQYCGRQFIPVWLPAEQVFPENVTWIHYSGKEEYTRVTEFKKITDHRSSSTLLGVEVPAPRGRYYPVQSPTELTRYNQYVGLYPKNFYSIGRLGTHRYKGIPDAIRDALDAVKVILG